jgi:hypothetical protein
MKNMSFLAGAIAFAVANLALPAVGYADSFPLTFSNTGSGVNCSVATPCGTVDVTNVDANTLQFVVTLNSGNFFHINNSESGSIFFFQLPGTLTLASSTANLGWTASPTFSLVAGTQIDGFGIPTSAIRVTNDANNFDGTKFTFAVDDTQNVTASDLQFFVKSNGDPTNVKLATDIGFNCTGTGANIACAATGFAAAPGPLVGAGLPGLVAACGGLLALVRHRRRKLMA